MRLKTVSLAAAAVALSTAPIAAQAQLAPRDAAPVDGESEIGGGSQLVILAVVAAVIFAGIAITDDDDPLSP